MIKDGYGLGFVIVVPQALYFYGFMNRHICSVLILLIDVENIPKNPAKSMRAKLACLFTCVCIAHVLKIPFI